MDRLKLDIVEISEVRWKDEQDFSSGEYRIINTSVGCITGVGLIMKKKITTRFNYYDQRSYRIIVVKTDTTIIVQVYMPTSDDEEIEEIYEELKEIIQKIKGDET